MVLLLLILCEFIREFFWIKKNSDKGGNNVRVCHILRVVLFVSFLNRSKSKQKSEKLRKFKWHTVEPEKPACTQKKGNFRVRAFVINKRCIMRICYCVCVLSCFSLLFANLTAANWNLSAHNFFFFSLHNYLLWIFVSSFICLIQCLRQAHFRNHSKSSSRKRYEFSLIKRMIERARQRHICSTFVKGLVAGIMRMNRIYRRHKYQITPEKKTKRISNEMNEKRSE